MATLSEGFQQVKLDDAGTYGAYNPTTSQAIAFPDAKTLTNFFGEGSTFDPNAAKASFDVSGLLGANAGQVKPISLSSLTPASSLTVPTAQPQPDSLAPATASAQQTSKSLQDYIKELTPPPTETSKQYDSLLGELNTLLPGLTGRGEAQLQAEQQAGLPDQKKRLAEINAQLLQKVAEATKVDSSYEQLVANLENPANAQQLGIPMAAIIGQQAQARKMQLAERNSKAADIGLLQAYALGLQGQVQAAQEGVNRAIDLKYADRESTVNLKMQQLQLLEGKLNKEEQIVKQALERKYQEEQAKIVEEKAKAKENINLAFSANIQTKLMNKGGEWSRVADGKTYGTPEELFKDFPELKGDFANAYKMGYVTDLTAKRLADIDFVQQLRNKYPDAGISLGDNPDSAFKKVQQNSYLYGKDTYIAPEKRTILPESVKIGEETYFLGPEGSLYPASDFVVGGTPTSQSKYTSYSGGPLKLTGTQSESLAGFTNTAQSAQQALRLLDQGVSTGPLADISLGAKKLLGKADPRQLELEQVLAQIKANFTKALSGATVSEQEVKRLSKFLPDNSDQESTIRSKLTNLINEMTKQQTNFLDAMGGQINPNFTGPLNTSLSTFTGPTFNSVGNTSASNQVKGTSQTISKAQPIDPNSIGKPIATISSVLPRLFPPGSTGGQCGDFVRRVVNSFGGTYSSLGNSLKSKVAAVQKYGTSLSNARVGSVIVTKENPTYGHVAYIIGRNAQGFIVAESNFKQSNKVSYGRIIPYNSNKIVGVINPTRKA